MNQDSSFQSTEVANKKGKLKTQFPFLFVLFQLSLHIFAWKYEIQHDIVVLTLFEI